MKRKLFTLAGIVLMLLINGCKAPDALYMVQGEELSEQITSEKMSVAVFPAVDWAELEGCFQGYMTYGLGGAFSRKEAFPDADLVFTNELTRALWKKNKMVVVKKDAIMKGFEDVEIDKEEIFPKNEVIGFLNYSLPVKSETDAGFGMAPNYEKLYDIGANTGADLVVLTRITKNTQAPVLTMNPLGVYPPYTLIVGVGSSIAQGLILKQKKIYVSIDIMILNVKDRNVVSFGGFNKIHQTAKKNKGEFLEDINSVLTFYMPLPEDEDLMKDWLAEAGSYAANLAVNYAVSTLTGFEIGVRFEFDYEYTDDTWQMYPEDYFDTNYGFTDKEFNGLFY